MVSVIINADDFGIRESTSNRIVKAISKGILSSTTILANGIAKEMIVACAKEYPNVSYGVHLNLTSGESLLKDPCLIKEGVIDHNGTFTGKIRTLYRISDESKKAIKRELKAQIDVVKSLGVKMSHFDGHHHVHSLPCVKPIVAELLREYNIKKVRLDSLIGTRQIVKDFLRAPTYGLNEYYLRNLFHNSFTTTDFFYSIDGFYEFLSNGGKIGNNSTIELMCHLGDHHVKERDLVENESLRHILDYKLISYLDL